MSRIEQLNKLLEVDPTDPDVLYMLAQEHDKLGEHARAVEHYDRCIALDPAYHYAYFHKARSLQAAGDLDGARSALQQGLERSRAGQDAKAAGEIQGFLDELS